MNDWSALYPRPRLRRNSFFSLNGPWQVNGQTIEVPFPPQSALSGWQGLVPEHLHYSRTFALPEGFCPEDGHVRLQIGAADQLAQVFINGRPAVQHEGGYLPFSADITQLLKPGENRLDIDIMDALLYRYPSGKQCKKPHGMWYTPVSGLWQTVWLEAVPPHPVEAIHIVPDTTGIILRVDTQAESCRAMLRLDDTLLSFPLVAGKETRIDIPAPHLWSPDDPFVYDMIIETAEERVETSFTLRTVDIRTFGGYPRVCLNGKPIFLHGVLDQGYFHDGLFLPVEPEEYLRDIRRMKALGFNLLRKHIKIEPECFYDMCDREGMLVLQDMVNSGPVSYLLDTVLPTIGLQYRPDTLPFGDKQRHAFFERHCLDTQKHLQPYGCIIGYTIFNEGWGQFDSDRLYRLLKAADPSRVYDSTSGWFAQKESDFDSRHIYFRNKHIQGDHHRALFLSECGGYTREIPGHSHVSKKSWGYSKPNDSAEALTDMLDVLFRDMVIASIPDGLCGCILTQLSDVEEELNGLYTYDREVCKVDMERMRQISEAVCRAADAAVQ